MVMSATALGTLAVPSLSFGQNRSAKPKVVIIGGGAGGASAAHELLRAAGDTLNITLIDRESQYTTCFYSNLYLGGFRDFDSITHNWDALSEMGVNKVTGSATGIDREAKTVSMEDGSSIAYDRLIVSPGIDLIYDSVPGYSEEAAETAPHAWKAGPQTQLLKEKLDALQDGDQIVMVPPPNPYRCPPGPYERVSMMAHVLKEKGFTNSRIIILDPKPSFSKQVLFTDGWQAEYPGMVEWIGPEIHGGVAMVDVEAGTVETDFDTFQGALLNIVPAQKAGAIATEAGLADDSGFCPIDAESMRSTMDENIFVLGDATIAGDMPKSAFSANSQAKVCANAVRADLTDTRKFPAKYSNTCWSLIQTDNGVKVGAQYSPVDGKITSTADFVSQQDETAEIRKATYEESIAWYDAITQDMFAT
ncbi:putative flavocytochrome C sulfide dehydrogenase, flavoprotein subunit [Fulvimarina pelagi HTCC2506]|nr:putative flavocytochrome C sulfide dehydrogenase, flavoprotein subunit [Fulvimarina pelagi HTCC2506]